MAKSIGILKIEGTVEDLTFYKRDGKNFVRTKGGVSKERILNDPNYVRTRENNSEFGLSAKAGRTLRLSMGNLVFRAKDQNLTSRMLQTMYRVKNFDTTSSRGSRSVAIGITKPEAKLLLVGFDFNALAPFKSVFYGTMALDSSTGEVSITSFIPAENLQFPQGATHVSFQAGVLGIEFESEKSELVLSAIENLPISMSVTNFVLTPTSMPSGFAVTLFVVMVSFFQEVNGVQYSLRNEEYNVLHVLNVV
jgi:hypothetical protein